ncbi:unnamed protein product [Caenorhabditis nigoni]
MLCHAHPELKRIEGLEEEKRAVGGLGEERRLCQEAEPDYNKEAESDRGPTSSRNRLGGRTSVGSSELPFNSHPQLITNKKKRDSATNGKEGVLNNSKIFKQPETIWRILKKIRESR